jgi:hypothetical protein
MYGMSPEKGSDKRERFGVCESLKGGLLLESCPK